MILCCLVVITDFAGILVKFSLSLMAECCGYYCCYNYNFSQSLHVASSFSIMIVVVVVVALFN